jgi:drug/metabolite transporter (DMT)-like permease
MNALALHVTLLVLFAGLLHASWNALIKARDGDPLLDTALVTAGSWLSAGLVLPFVPMPDAAAWPFIATSTVLHFGYYIALAGAYRHGDLGYAYPLMRGTAPLLVTLSGVVFLGEIPSVPMVLGILLISGGIVSIAVLRPGQRMPRAALGWALANAVIIAAYTVVDGAGVRAAGNAASYVAWLLFVESVPFIVYAAWRRRSRWLSYTRLHWPRGLIGGACSAAAYGIVLWAMTRAPVGVISALRETSVLFAAIIGSVMLKESFGARRLAGAALVVAGIAALKV